MKPKRLKIGSKIGIVSPSDPIREINEEEFSKGLDNLKSIGFEVVLGKNIRSKNPKERAKDFNEMFSRNDIDAVIATKGGDTAQDTLPFVDWEILEKNPKIFMGFSDITVYLNAIYAKTGLITFSGNDARYGFGAQLTEYGKSEFENRLMHGETGKVPANGERKTIIGGVGEGKLIGGNLRCLLKIKQFGLMPDFQNTILMLEAYHLTPVECREMFSELDSMKAFEKVSGILIGHIYGMEIEHPEGEQMEKIILEFVKNKPILKCQDFGHNTPNTTLPIGARIRVDATNKKIELIEDFVE